LNSINEQISQVENKQRQATERFVYSRRQLREERNSLLAGDPRINSLEQQVQRASDELREANAEMVPLIQERNFIESALAQLRSQG
jgi:chromosome segregation ATPase